MNQKGFTPIIAVFIVVGLIASTFVINKFASTKESSPKESQIESPQPSISSSTEPISEQPSEQPDLAQYSLTLTPTPISTPESKHICPEVPKVVCPTLNPISQPTLAPIVPENNIDCKINSECGGGTIKLPKSTCDKIICCGIPGGGVLVFSDNACNLIQYKTRRY